MTTEHDVAFEAALPAWDAKHPIWRAVLKYLETLELEQGGPMTRKRFIEIGIIVNREMRAIWDARGEADARVCERAMYSGAFADRSDISVDDYNDGCERCATAIRGMK
jgi:hypothetical protein